MKELKEYPSKKPRRVKKKFAAAAASSTKNLIKSSINNIKTLHPKHGRQNLHDNIIIN